jgi:hypothetical protein
VAEGYIIDAVDGSWGLGKMRKAALRHTIGASGSTRVDTPLDGLERA